MKDLKHLYYFENLLEEVNNDLVREGLQRGDIAIGSVCSLIPEFCSTCGVPLPCVCAHRGPAPSKWGPTT